MNSVRHLLRGSCDSPLPAEPHQPFNSSSPSHQKGPKRNIGGMMAAQTPPQAAPARTSVGGAMVEPAETKAGFKLRSAIVPDKSKQTQSSEQRNALLSNSAANNASGKLSSSSLLSSSGRPHNADNPTAVGKKERAENGFSNWIVGSTDVKDQTPTSKLMTTREREEDCEKERRGLERGIRSDAPNSSSAVTANTNASIPNGTLLGGGQQAALGGGNAQKGLPAPAPTANNTINTMYAPCVPPALLFKADFVVYEEPTPTSTPVSEHQPQHHGGSNNFNVQKQLNQTSEKENGDRNNNEFNDGTSDYGPLRPSKNRSAIVLRKRNAPPESIFASSASSMSRPRAGSAPANGIIRVSSGSMKKDPSEIFSPITPNKMGTDLDPREHLGESVLARQNSCYDIHGMRIKPSEGPGAGKKVILARSMLGDYAPFSPPPSALSLEPTMPSEQRTMMDREHQHYHHYFHHDHWAVEENPSPCGGNADRDTSHQQHHPRTTAAAGSDAFTAVEVKTTNGARVSIAAVCANDFAHE